MKIKVNASAVPKQMSIHPQGCGGWGEKVCQANRIK